MLVLSRKVGESIVIGDEVEVIVLATEGEAVKLGVKAPRHVAIFRKEIYQAIQEANKDAAQHSVSFDDLRGLTEELMKNKENK